MAHSATVVGAGPAGLMAAEVLAKGGVDVVVYDLRRSPGRKFLLAGRGGLNLTHSEPLDVFLTRYAVAEPTLLAAIRAFDPNALQDWCAGLGEAPFVGSSGRVFPKSFRATPLLRAWLHRLAASGVEFHGDHRWAGWADPPTTSCFERRDGSHVEIASDCTVLAFGGASWPSVSSDGGWAPELARLGVELTPLVASNCGVALRWSSVFSERFAGTPVKNVAVGCGGESVRGDLMVTRTGLEGGPVYALSPALRSREHGAAVEIDFFPDHTLASLVEAMPERRAKETMTRWLTRCGMAPVAVGLLREATDNDLPTEPSELARLAKATRLTIDGLMPLERAISTAGGVRFDQIDDSFMLRAAPGVFVAGEMLDFDAPTGGYLLQASFSTGVAAAKGALARLG